MLDPDFFLGLAIIVAPFAFVGAMVFRQRKAGNGFRYGAAAASTSLNTNGLPMVGAVDVNGNAFGAVGFQAPHLGSHGHTY